MCYKTLFLGAFGSNGSSVQGFQPDGDSSNTTVISSSETLILNYSIELEFIVGDLFNALGIYWWARPNG